MAYLRTLIGCHGTREYAGCTKPATVELLTRRNESYGKFCRPCGDKALKRLQDAEKAEDEGS